MCTGRGPQLRTLSPFIPTLACESRKPPTPGHNNDNDAKNDVVNNDAERDTGSRRPSAAGTETAPVDLLTGDAPMATPTAAASSSSSKNVPNGVSSSSCAGAGAESHPSPSVSVSSSSTEPMSDSSDTAPAPMAVSSSSSSSSSWEQEQQQQQQVQDKRSAPVVVDKSTVAEIYKVCTATVYLYTMI